ncbi:hypothetical protein [Clostridium sp. VAP41]|uniref:hypothetical protein n=1 Tax=Clostridium sp. VAP41 TaxID=2949979 RepID=UPI00207ACFC7|nr:hypothetical protein [Clostridium sp. VAP41]
MPYEMGGRADKSGNRYEIRCVMHQMLKLLEEKIYSVTLEALGDDEQGVDLWIDYLNGNREGQQCKGRNGSRESWTISSMKAHDIFVNWKMQLDRNEKNKVALVSPLSCSLIIDLIDRANNTDGDYEHFYNIQICKSSKQLKKVYTDYAEAMELNINDKKDIIKSIDYLKRTFYRQEPDFQLKEIILDKIRYLLIGDEYKIYDAFVAIIIDGDILGKQITSTFLYELLKSKGIKLKNLALDKRITPRINELNDEYSKFFLPIKNGLIERKEFDLCRKIIDLGESMIIHGKAGNGKSGCTEEILNYCKKNIIPVIAIKLDKRVPVGSAEKWGQDLGLPASLAHCLHSISKDEQAVIILDQLDALRWTQAHSRDSLLVCAEVINEIIKINIERKKKISVVFVCRTYDLENDNNIKALFKSDENSNLKMAWNKIPVDEFDDNTVKEVVGEQYSGLSHKLKSILKTPSNLYIWCQLSSDKDYNECSTTSHLILEWWTQLKSNSMAVGVSENDVINVKEKLVQLLDKMGRISISKRIFRTNENALFYLSSNGFLIVQGDNISFIHQSILDYFLAEAMIDKFYGGEKIVNIVGDKEKQTPSRRYQVQMLLQNLVEMDSRDFINVGEQMLKSDSIRYYMKHVFYEVLGQVSNIDEPIRIFVLKSCEVKEYIKYILNNVIMSHSNYISMLRDNGILDKWMQDEDTKYIVFNLLQSISPRFDSKDIVFIKKYILKSKSDDEKLIKCFNNNINEDTNEMFDLRMQLYEKYPEMANVYFNFKEMFKKCEMRTIKFFTFLLKYKIKGQEKNIYKYEEELVYETADILVNGGGEIVKMLLPNLPCESYEAIIFSEWCNRYGHENNLERACVQIIKKVNAAIISNNPKEFLEIYNQFMGKGFAIFNEIILSALLNLPEEYSDYVINYLCEDFDKNVFDMTSGDKNKLLLAKGVLKKHSASCSDKVYSLLENKIIHYISPDAKERYSRRVEYNKNNTGDRAYWSFWGDLQAELLPCLQINRMSEEGKRLLTVLKRRFEGEYNIYDNSSGHSGWVKSPISEKKLSNKSWIKLLTNKKIKGRRNNRWKEVLGGFIESSIEEFSGDFRSAVSVEPERMIELVLGCEEEILDEYIDSLFSGIASYNEPKDISTELLEELIERYPCDSKSWRASSICRIIEMKKDSKWSQKVLDILKDISINHINPELGKPNVTNKDDKEMRTFEMLQDNSLNCVRGAAAFAIGKLLWEDKQLYVQFKETINQLTKDENPAVKLASLSALWPTYNIERDWASEKILTLYEQDHRLAGFHDSRSMFFLLYPKYRERVLKIISKCFLSSDEQLIKMGSYSLAEMYIVKNEFLHEMDNMDSIAEKQAKSILEMVVIYFDKDEYNDICKKIILKFKTSEFDLDFPVSNLFYQNKINLERDNEFLIEIMQSNLSKRTISAFVHYLEKNSKSIVDYKDIILSMSYHLLSDDSEKLIGYWGIEDEISKLIIGLYDETSTSLDSELIEISKKCLDIWDLMFEKQIGSIRMLSQKIFER